ncbi:sigma-54-dependent transcriptional regulator [Acanthopleuribacter pedis]|uniref:Sigma-54-dependent Fis family transcriptional regulator n=1 Tax=Acanthopleuribacter pedis TaxID=442870 RepID=A0A8J7Q8Y8_9BACT|nr:sigma-54 dependent transcriptional regulator [Acanthopleuribacter pedis]MBO1320761.1 sigma-54-dependent Fis family transcriptional regulator [Acanthopleuribacter pedis]
MRILLVEDDPSFRDLLVSILVSEDYQVTACADGAKAWDIYRRDPFPIVVTDWMLPKMDGLELTRHLRKLPEGDATVVVVITANNKIENLREVLAAGADDYISKPFDLELFMIRMTIACNQAENLAKKQRAEKNLRDLRRELEGRNRFHDFVGKSRPMQQVYQLIRDIAKLDTTVMINGETGTGKELVARAIHEESSRSRGPFITVNCGGISESLIASMLFGHRKGSFTGAVADQQGVFESANGGTLFLDEIGDLPLNLQTSFLRVLESRTITRVGETQVRPVDVRVVAATHHELSHLVAQGRFRQDLMYRIRVARVLLPPLRERREDIPLLVQHFLRSLRAQTGKDVETADEHSMGKMMGYAWPGNVRELRNAVEFAFIRARNGRISQEDLPPEMAPNAYAPPPPAAAPPVYAPMHAAPPQPAAPRFQPSQDRAAAMREALAFCNGSHTDAAKHLGISRATYYRWLKKYGIQ